MTERKSRFIGSCLACDKLREWAMRSVGLSAAAHDRIGLTCEPLTYGLVFWGKFAGSRMEGLCPGGDFGQAVREEVEGA